MAVFSFISSASPLVAMAPAPSTLRFSEDLETWAQLGVLGLVVVTTLLLYLEVRSAERQRLLLFTTGVAATLLLAGAVLRPSRLSTRGHEVPGLSVALLDSSHRLAMPSDDLETSRAEEGEEALEEMKGRFSEARLEVRRFTEELLPEEQKEPSQSASSDVLQALRSVASGEGERPQSIVLLSDGRVTKPGPLNTKDWETQVRAAAGGIPVHTVFLAEETPNDRSIREVGFTGTAVAHQPLTMKLEVGCEPHDLCSEVEVVVRELIEGQTPVELVRGKTQGDQGIALLELQVTLERAGGRVIEVELVSDERDDIPKNDRRVLPVQVRRDRLRMLHVAGRPTYDVRALRMFLKSDESIDLVSFFILRTPDDQVGARPDELALIPFPVDELFSEHLKSFDAIILQDIDAPRYGLDKYFPSMKRYVLEGGGLILVGGQTGFSSGGYAGSEVADVLPVELPTHGELISKRPFVPTYTDAGRSAPLLSILRATMGEELTEMSGANLFGRPLPGAVVLWQHPTLSQAGQSGGDPMPVLALREAGDGRSIAISVDSTHQLRFGAVGAQAGGRAYADLWGGLLGWLMRDPRYEGAQLRLIGDCVAGRDLTLLVEPPPPSGVPVEVSLERLGAAASDTRILDAIEPAADGSPRYLARQLGEGGYAARVKVGEAPPTRAVFACEAGGPAWSDSRPDVPRLAAIAKATGGVAVGLSDLERVPPPQGTFIAAQRQSSPVLPPWIWAIFAAVLMSIHWVLRRAVGYA